MNELRDLIRAEPRGAVRTLRHGADLDPAVTLILLAEAYQRLYHRHGYTDMTPPTIAVDGDTVLYRMWRPVTNG